MSIPIITPSDLDAFCLRKHKINEARTWPDWRTSDPNQAIEHVRGNE